MSARFLECVNVNAGAKVDDLYAVLVALDYAGNEVGAVYGGYDDHVVVHIRHGHKNVKLGSRIALGSAGLHVYGYAHFLARRLVAILHVCPESVGQGYYDCAYLDVAEALGHCAELLLHGGVKVGIELLYCRGKLACGLLGRYGLLCGLGLLGRCGFLSGDGLLCGGGRAACYAQRHYGSEHDSKKFLHGVFFLR